MKKFILLALFATQIFAFSASRFVNDARSQIGVTLSYDPSYERLAYPMGDVDIKKGVSSITGAFNTACIRSRGILG